MLELPIAVFTKNRTSCAVAVAEALLANLSCSGRRLRYIVCDDMSVPGHLEAVLSAFRRHGVEPSVHVNTPERQGLGASMNNGLRDAFSTSDKCLRIEDDWLLKRPLDLGPWVSRMDDLEIGSLRLGMMFRKKSELRRFDDYACLLKVCSARRQRFTFNNQVAVLSRSVHEIVGEYPENASPSEVEIHGGHRYNQFTDFGARPPYVAWPAGWETGVNYGENMAFAHIGVSISNHNDLYPIPGRYLEYNTSARDEELRRAALQEAVGGKVGIL